MIKYLDFHDVFRNGTLVTPISKDGTQYVHAGTTVCSVPAECRTEKVYREIEQKHGISFIYDDEPIEIPFYCVPLVDFFATDADGYFGTLGGNTDFDTGVIYYIGKNRDAYYVCENLRALVTRDSLQKTPAKADTIRLFDSLKEAQSQLPFLTLNLPDSYFESM